MKQFLMLLPFLFLLFSCGGGENQGKDSAPLEGTHASAPEADEPETDAEPETPESSEEEANDMEAISTLNQTEGSFFEIQWGDYAHFVIETGPDEYESYWIAAEVPEDEWEPFDGAQHKGKQVRVTWQEVTRYIEEAGGEETFKEMTKVDLLE